jgi:two-component sensor histidine kinase
VTDYYHRTGDKGREAETWQRLGDCITNTTRAFIDEKMRCYKRAALLFGQAGLNKEEAEAFYRPIYLGCYDYLLQFGPEEKETDSALATANMAVALFEKVHDTAGLNKALTFQGKCYFAKDDLAHGEASFQRIADYYHQTGDAYKEGVTLLDMGVYMYGVNGFAVAEKIKNFERAKKLFAESHDTLYEVNAAKMIAQTHLEDNQVGLAENELLGVVKDYQALHYTRLYLTLDLLRNLYRKKGDLQKEVFYTIETEKSVESAEGENDKAYYYRWAANTYLQAGMYDRSLAYDRKAWNDLAVQPDDGMEYYDLALAIVRTLLGKDSVARASSFISEAVRRRPPLSLIEKERAAYANGLCYAAQRNFRPAERCYLQMLAFADSIGRRRVHEFSRELMLLDYQAVGDLYMAMHDYKKAALFFKKIVIRPEDDITVFNKMSIERSLSRSDSALGNYFSAMRHFEQYKQLNDLLYNVEKSRQIAEVQTKYETEQKDNDLRLQAKSIQLLTAQTRGQLIEAEKSRIQRNMMVAGLGFSLLLVAMIFNRYRMKQRNNRLLTRQKQAILAQNQRLEKLLQENEWLLREVHHRVKNNLQVVMSLLNSQSAYLQDEQALNAVMESRHRVQAMSLIHQRLYQSSNVSVIQMQEYIMELVYYLRDSFTGGQGVYFDLDIQAISLDVVQAVPVGLILNEVITNIFKHAFSNAADDRITIRFARMADGETELMIADNGRGLPSGYDPAQSGTFGMLLIHGLVEDLDGRLEIDRRKGTTYRIRFESVWPQKDGDPQATAMEGETNFPGIKV